MLEWPAVVTAVAELGTVPETVGRSRVRWALLAADLLVPFAVFARQIGVWTLRPLAATEMMRGDWTTYIAAPNFLRTAPLLTFPLGRVPGYISPPGISLAMADANPLLTPLYRLGNALSPDHPIQFVGWQLLASYVLAYVASTRFIETGAVRLRSQTLDIGDRAVARLLAAALLIMPMFSMRWIHVSLTNQWIVIAALYLALFRRRYTPADVGWRVGLMLLAPVVQPYFVPMVAMTMVPYVIGGLRRAAWRTLFVSGATVVGVFAVAALFGFIGDGFSAESRDYGSFPADVTTMFSPRGYGRWLPDLPHHPKNTEGLGFVGLGVLALIVVAIAVVARRRLPRRIPGAAWSVLAACGALAVFATWPRIRVFGWTILDVSRSPLALNAIGHVFRVNGRFIWPAIWLTALAAGAVVLAWRDHWRNAIVVALVTVQFVDTKPEHITSLPTVVYDQSHQVLAEERANGATSVQLQPPWVAYQCYAGYDLKYDAVAPFILAAAALRMPVNSGYPARPALDAKRQICQIGAERFNFGVFDPHVVYIRSIMAPDLIGLKCRTMTDLLRACRSTRGQ